MSIDKIRRSVLIVAAGGALAVAGLFAGRLSAGAFPQGHSHADFAPHLFAHISQALELTDDQKAKVKDVLRTHADDIKAQMRASSTARRALRDAVIAQPTDENAIRAAALQVGQSQGDAALLFAKIRTEVDPLLTPQQKQRIQSFQAHVSQHPDRPAQSFDAFLKGNS